MLGTPILHIEIILRFVRESASEVGIRYRFISIQNLIEVLEQILLITAIKVIGIDMETDTRLPPILPLPSRGRLQAVLGSSEH